MTDYKKKAEKADNADNKRLAIKYLLKYFKTTPEYEITPEDYNLMGCLYHELFMKEGNNDIDLIIKATPYFVKAHELAPYQPIFLQNLEIMYNKTNQNELQGELFKYEQEHGLFTDDEKFEFACFSLKIGDLENFYKYYDSRFLKSQHATIYPKFDIPMWQGEDISDKVLLVHWEQGFGDTFLFSGYLKRLADIAKEVYFVCQDNTFNILRKNKFASNVYIIPNSLFGFAMQNDSQVKFDCHIPCMSVPARLNLSKEELCVGHGYLKLDDKLVKEFKDKYFNNDKIKIGIAFKGNKGGEITRDIDIGVFKVFKKMPNVKVYNFTKDETTDFIDVAKDCKDFEETACCLANLDYLISGDNVIMNLAGAIGVKTCAMFNWQANFRYFDLENNTVGWFDEIIKPYKCAKMNDWQNVLNNIIEDLDIIENSI